MWSVMIEMIMYSNKHINIHKHVLGSYTTVKAAVVKNDSGLRIQQHCSIKCFNGQYIKTRLKGGV